MARIGEDVTERLDVIPAQFRVLVTRRSKIRLPALLRGGGPGPCAGTCRARRAPYRSADRTGHGGQIWRPQCATNIPTGKEVWS